MTNEILEYHPNGKLKHYVIYHPNGNKCYEQFYDKDGRDHRKNNLPDFQSWYKNGRLNHKAYAVHGKYHNICNPATILLFSNGKVNRICYYIDGIYFPNKLNWRNKIKNI